MDKILDAEYKVVEHQIAPPLGPSPRWRFQQLSSPKWPARMRSSSRAADPKAERDMHN